MKGNVLFLVKGKRNEWFTLMREQKYIFHLTNEIIDGFFGKENRLKMR